MTIGGTLGVTGVVTANAGVVVDNITIDGTEIDLSSGDLTLDSAGDIILDADGADILLKDAGTTFGELTNSSTDFVIKSTTSNKDILFKGNDAGSAITALTLDMSDAGTAIFNHDMKLADNSKLLLGDDLNGVIQVSSSSKNLKITNLTDDADIDIRSDDGSGGDAVYFRADGSTGAAKMFHLGSEKIATTSSGAEVTGTLAATLSTAAQPNITSLGTLTTLTVDDITINASSISDAGDLTIDSGGDISLDADDGQVILKDGGAAFGKFVQNSSNFHIVATVQDKDIKFFGNDGGASITALALDMSNAGAATFNNNVICNRVETTDGVTDTGQAGSATVFNDSGSTADFRVESTSNTHMLFVDGGLNRVGIGTDSPDVPFHIEAGQNVIAELEATHTDGNARMLFKPKDNNGWNIGANDNGSFTIFDVVGNTNSVVIETGAAASTLVVDSNSRVGIGTASPSVALHTVGKVRAQKSGQTSAYVQLSANDVTSNYAADIFVNDTALTFKHNSNSRGFVFDQNGSERMRIDSSGRVGIGTSSPASLLHIESASAPTLRIDDSDSTNALTLAQDGSNGSVLLGSAGELSIGVTNDSSSDAVSLKTRNTTRLYVKEDGNVGIGTSSPAESLHTSGNIRLGDSAPAELYTNSSELRLGVDKNDDNDTSNITFYVNNSEKARIDKDGFFGIGTTAPDVEFHVMRSSSSASYNYASRYVAAFERNGACDVGIRSNSTNASALSFSDEDDADVGRISYVHSDNSLRITVNTAEAMRIDSGGNALFNRTGQIGTHRMSVNFASGSSEKGMGINSSDAGATTHMTFLVEASAKGSISTDGSTTTYNTSSDARLKDVTGEARGLEVVNKLNPVSYNWKETGISDEGLIAQELEGIVPNAIVQDDDGYYQMDYSKLVTHLVKAVQEQQEQIESLTSEIAILKEK